MEKTHTIPWGPAEPLETEEDLTIYLNVALENGDPRLIIGTLGDIARALTMSMVVREMRLTAFSFDSASQLSKAIC